MVAIGKHDFLIADVEILSHTRWAIAFVVLASIISVVRRRGEVTGVAANRELNREIKTSHSLAHPYKSADKMVYQSSIATLLLSLMAPSSQKPMPNIPSPQTAHRLRHELVFRDEFCAIRPRPSPPPSPTPHTSFPPIADYPVDMPFASVMSVSMSPQRFDTSPPSLIPHTHPTPLTQHLLPPRFPPARRQPR